MIIRSKKTLAVLKKGCSRLKKLIAFAIAVSSICTASAQDSSNPGNIETLWVGLAGKAESVSDIMARDASFPTRQNPAPRESRPRLRQDRRNLPHHPESPTAPSL